MNARAGGNPPAPTVAHGLVFHRLHSRARAPCGQGSLDERDLEAVIHAAGPTSFLSPEEWVARLSAGTLQPEDRCLTFDDGLLCQHDVALPVLDRLGLKAFWFVFSSVFEGGADGNEISQHLAARHFGSFEDYVREFLARCPAGVRAELDRPAYQAFAEALQRTAGFYTQEDLAYRYVRNRILGTAGFERIVDDILADRGLSVAGLATDIWMADDHLRDLSRAGHWIGLHSYDHPFEMARLPRAEQERQFSRNRDHVRRVTGIAPRSMSHPLNSYDETTLAVLSALGIECGFRHDVQPPAGKDHNPGPLELSRVDAIHLLRRRPPN